LALLAGLWLGLEVASRVGAARGIDGDRIYNLGFATVVAGILGARMGFVLANLSLYTGITPWTRALLSVFALAPGTEIAWIGVLAALIAAAQLIRRWQLPPLPLADSFAPGIVVFVAGIGLANLLSGDAYGSETSLLWGIPLWGAMRHPTQILTILAALMTLAVLWRTGGLPVIAERGIGARMPGHHALVTVISLGFSMLLIEPLRADSPVIFGNIRVWQVVALVGLVSSMAIFALRAPTTGAPATGGEKTR
jgi:phosphatidylglycerol:prolipoprotein diacylglycerol transferase